MPRKKTSEEEARATAAKIVRMIDDMGALYREGKNHEAVSIQINVGQMVFKALGISDPEVSANHVLLDKIEGK